MTEIPQIILTIRALEYEGGPIAYFTSLMDVTIKGKILHKIRFHCLNYCSEGNVEGYRLRIHSNQLR